MKHAGLVSSLVFGCLLTATAHAEDTHAVSAAPGKTKVGTPATMAVTIEGKNGWHLNAEAPITMKLSPSAGVTVPKDKLGRGDLAESTQQRARFDVTATPNDVGPKRIEAEARFVMCQETACKPVKETVVLALEALASEAPGDGKAKATSKAGKRD